MWSVECSFRWLQPSPSHTDRNGGHAEAAPQMRGRRGVWRAQAPGYCASHAALSRFQSKRHAAL